VRRLAPLAIATLALAACDETSGECPGDPVASFTFDGTRVPAGGPSLAGLDPFPSIPDCEAAVGYPPGLDPFPGVLSSGPSPMAAALCRPGARVMFGQRAADRFVVETTTEGAVLGGCAGCPARLRLVVAGDVLPGGTSPPTGFAGVLVEVLSATGGDCGTCLLPCAARYALNGSVP